MADCLFQFQNDTVSPIRINPGIEHQGTLSNQFDVDYYDYEMAEQETVTFTISIIPQTTQQINVELRLYGLDAFGNVQELGQAVLAEFNNVFTYDGVPGQYWFCLSSDFPVDYTMTLDYTNYPYTLFAAFDAYDGAYMPVTDFAPGIRFCNETVFYQIIDGVLPPGLQMSSTGQIFGVIEELDCYPPYKDEPPSWTKFMNTEAGAVPSTMDFPITVRAAFVSDPEGVYADRQFTICISNDWTPQRDAFIETAKNMEQEIFDLVEVPEEDQPLEQGNENQLTGIVPICEPCPEPELPKNITPLTEEELKKLCEICQINDEFSGLVEINKDGLCVPCEEPEVETVTNELSEKLTSSCIPCEESEPIVGIQDVVLKPLCQPCQVEEVEIKSLPQMFRQVPNFQLPAFINKVMTEKACVPFYVENLKDVYPMIPEEKIELSGLCPKVCE